MTVNTTDSVKKANDEDIAASMSKMSRDMQRVFSDSPTQTIQIIRMPGDKDDTVEGGINGHFWRLKKGVVVPDVPLPILDTLDEANIPYSKLGPVQQQAKPARKRAEPAGN